MSRVLSALMQGFFGKQQYAAKAPRVLTMKLSNDLCLECSTCAIFFNSSFTVSMMALFLNNSLSDMLISAPLILFFSFVTSCIPSTKRRSNRCLLIYPLSATSLPYRNSTKALYSRGCLSSTSPGVIMKFSSTPFSLHTM